MRFANTIPPSLVRPALIAIASASLLADPVLRINSPANGAVFQPGQTMQVKVSATAGAFLGVVLAGPDPIPWPETILTHPPYEFFVAIPSSIKPGIYWMRAVGSTTEHGHIRSEILNIDVERPDLPASISIDLPRTVRFSVGESDVMRVFGKFSDGTQVELTRSTKTRYKATPEGVVSVNKDGVITAISPGEAQVSVDDKIFVKAIVRAK